MNNNIHYTPEIRFNCFSNNDTWEKSKIGDLINVVSFRPYLKEPSKDAKYEIIQQGDNPILGYANGKPYKDFEKITIFGDHTLSLYKPNKPFFVASDGVKILYSNMMQGHFFYYFLEKYKPKSQGYKRHLSVLKSCECFLPNHKTQNEEQYKLGEVFLSIDALINKLNIELQKLKILKKSMLQKLFPKGDSLIPEIRFKGFQNNWQRKKICELCKENNIKTPTPKNDYIRLGIRSYAKGTFHEKVLAGHGLDVETMYIVEANNLIVNITFAWEHAIAITDENDAGKLISHRFPQFKFNENQSPIFYKYSILDNKFKEQLDLASPGGAGRNRVLNLKQFKEITLKVPDSFEEQEKIGMYFKNLDFLIQQKHKELQKIKNIKQTLLKKMFV